MTLNITEVRTQLAEGGEGERLLAYCSITIDGCFAVRDLKVVAGSAGPFVAMPSRRLQARCPSCGCKNHLRSNYCGNCGSELDWVEDEVRLYADVAHPTTSRCREELERAVVDAVREERRQCT